MAQLGTSFGQAIASAAMACMAGVVAWARRDAGGAIFLAALVLLLGSTIFFVAVSARSRLRRTVREQAARLERQERERTTLASSLKRERGEYEQHLARLAGEMRELRLSGESSSAERTKLLAYAATIEDLLSGTVETCAGKIPAEIDRKLLLDDVLHIARSSLCQHRGADTKLAVLRDGPMGREVLHGAGVRMRGLCTTPRPLADLIADMAESTDLIRFELDGLRHHLVVLAEGTLSPADRSFARMVAGTYAVTDQVSTRVPPPAELERRSL